MLRNDTPVLEVEDNSSISEILRNSSSSGLVTRASTRVGSAPGTKVVTVATKLVMVGSSCLAMEVKLAAPTATMTMMHRAK